MKKVEAIIRTSVFEEVHQALSAVGVPFMTFSEVKGLGMETSTRTYRGATYDVGFIPRTKLEIVINSDKIDDVVAAILKHGRTGEVGDGKIFIQDIESAVRIRTGEKDEEALK